jgi:hypothetical protein
VLEGTGRKIESAPAWSSRSTQAHCGLFDEPCPP